MIDVARESSYPTPLANSTLLPLMLLSLASQKNSPSFTKAPSTILAEYDFIVVGAGSAGATVAARLSEMPCVNVLLLEAGSAPPLLTEIPGYNTFFWNTDIDWARLTAPQKHAGRLLENRQFVWPNGKGLGGSSLINGMEYVRGNRKDYDDWAAQGAHGWSYRKVLPYFKKMEDNANPGYVANGFYRIQSTVRNAQRCSTAKGYLVPAENRRNLDILPNAFVTKVIIRGKRAVGVNYEANNKIYKVRAKREVILSAGAVASPKLLMLSGVGPQNELRKHNIPVVANLPVGLNLQDHFLASVDFLLDSRIPTANQKLSDPGNIMNYIRRRQGPLSGGQLVSAGAFLKGNLTESADDYPNFELIFTENMGNRGLPSVRLTESAYQQVYGPYRNKPFYNCFVVLLHPKSRGTVRLRSSNPRDPPLIDPKYLAHEQDVKDMVDGMKVCQKIGTSASMQRVGSKNFNTSYPGCEAFRKNMEDYFKCQVRSAGQSGAHYVGTVKMGSIYDPSTVVDSRLRIKGIRGLRVVDASIMLKVPSGNTNAPTIMIGEKASDLIKQEIKCSEQ